jgi:choline dehydrogenase-like flavoprotein
MTRGQVPPDDPEGRIWDAVVIGTGAGGGTAGYALARAGRSVLFLERGKALDGEPGTVRGRAFAWTGRPEDALNYGWWPAPLHRKYGPTEFPAYQPIGAGTGGSTALFGMVMDRLRPLDFTPRRHFRDERDSSLPDEWPISYEALEPYYDAAERLYRVRGTPDPLTPRPGGVSEPATPTEKEAVVTRMLEQSGLSPYRIHYAQDRVAECRGCAAMLCPRSCRNDSRRVCVGPAVAEYGARVLNGCRVLRLEAQNRVVREAVCDWNGRRIAVRGRVFVLAANAFFTPALLQRSTSARFPDGLANGSGLVGRNLMVHVSDFVLARPAGRRAGWRGPMHHGVSLNDFYVHDGQKLGNVHVHPVAITGDQAVSFLRLHVKLVNRLPSAALNAVASAGAFLARDAIVFSTIVEDLPYQCNRVMARGASDESVSYEYRHPHELRRRAWTLYHALGRAVSGRLRLRPLRPVGGLNMSHACGTCRFGDDPATSVLDRDNRAHDLDNLYVVDASFFPSSGGINPSLTIAANSLRVSERIAARL